MKIIKLLSIFGILAALGCESDSNVSTPPAITSYKFQYMNFPNATYSVTSEGEPLDKLDVIYSNGKIIKLIGGISEMDPASGFSYIFRKHLFKKISYSGNTVTITDQLDSNTFTVYENKKTIEMDAQHKILSKINHSNFDSFANDTLTYFYQNNLLTRIEYHNRRLQKKSLFYYNAAKNLDSIVTSIPTIWGHPWTFDPTNKTRTVAKFENYDTATNPLKRFGIFEETFYRSLSKNNYRKYTATDYDSNGEEMGFDTKEWTFIYQDGQINFEL